MTYSFRIWNQSVVPCPVLTVASWLVYRFLKRQVRWSGMRNSFRNFHNLLWSTVKGFGIVNKAEIDIFLELSCFFNDPVDVWNLISGSSAFSKTSLNIPIFTVHVLLKPLYLLLWARIPQKKWSSHHSQQESLKCSTWMQSQNDRRISVHFQGKAFNITVIQGYALTSIAEEPEVEQSYEDPQDWNAKEGSQETPGVTGKLGLGVQNEGKG